MQLPSRLRSAIELEAEGVKPSELAHAATELSARYRTGHPFAGNFPDNEPQRIAYLATRMPATYAVLRSVFGEFRRLLPDNDIESLLDLGCGPGSALWAAIETFDELKKATLYDRDPHLIRLGKTLAANGDNLVLQNADWQIRDIRSSLLPPHQLVVCSYSLGEVGSKGVPGVLQRAWEATETAIIIIEPGTKRGFGLIRELRETLIEWGANLLAPCPHDRACPMGADDWCHFAERVERTSLHRYLKLGERGHEDEKYSYIIAAKQPGQRVPARVIRHPRRHSGFAQLTICGSDGIEHLTVRRSQKELWRKARKIDWGDGWEI
ncbi:MAG: rRNA methyltransferase [Acidobacteria bacterium]|nr:rRNA methyltransferase [Acidobacteriota bacterium]